MNVNVLTGNLLRVSKTPKNILKTLFGIFILVPDEWILRNNIFERRKCLGTHTARAISKQVYI